MKRNLSVILLFTLVVFVIAAVATASGLTFKNNQDIISYPQLATCLLVAVVSAFLYGFIRFSLRGGIALGVVVLNDMVLVFSLTALLSIVFPAMPSSISLPYSLALAAVVSVASAMPGLRVAQKTRKTEEVKDAITQAMKKTKLFVLVFSLVALAALMVIGNRMALLLVPLCLAVVISWESSQVLLPGAYLLYTPRKSGR